MDEMKVTDETIKLYNEHEDIEHNFSEFNETMYWNGVTGIDILPRIHESRDIFYHLNRFSAGEDDIFLKEVGGLELTDIEELKNAYRKLKIIDPNVELPLGSLLSAWTSRKKVIAAFPPYKKFNILEIGPGAGLTSLLFSNINLLYNYTQIEATQSLYLSQMAINAVAFADVYEAAIDYHDPFTDAGLWHIPWWRIEWIKEAQIKYDIVVANACLCELKPKALEIYSKLITNKASDDCTIVIQGPGLEHPNSRQQMVDTFLNLGWFLVATENDKDRGGKGDEIVNWWFNKTKRQITKPVKIPMNYSFDKLAKAING
jgi:hypothetical protein